MKMLPLFFRVFLTNLFGNLKRGILFRLLDLKDSLHAPFLVGSSDWLTFYILVSAQLATDPSWLAVKSQLETDK